MPDELANKLAEKRNEVAQARKESKAAQERELDLFLEVQELEKQMGMLLQGDMEGRRQLRRVA